MTTRKPLVIISGELSELPDGDSIAGVSGGSIIEQGNSSVEVIDTGTDGRVIVTADGSEIARFTAAGVAIGTDTLDAEDFLKVVDPATGQFTFGDGFDYGAPVLQIRSNNEDAGDAHLYLESFSGQGTGTISAQESGKLDIGTYGAPITFGIFFSEKMRIDSDGNVGIGTSSPVGKFNVIGGIGVGTLTGDNAVTPPTGAVVMAGGSYSAVQTYASPGNATVVGLLQNYLITSDFSRYLDIAALGSTGGAGANIRFLTGSDTATERMRITSGGELLVGTTSNPSDYKLVVSGITYASNYDVALTTAGSDTVALNFSGDTGLYTRSAAGTVTFTASNYRAGAIKTVRVIAGGSSRTLTFPNDWVFVGAKPASIASGKTGILTVTSFGTTEADCVAAWAVQT